MYWSIFRQRRCLVSSHRWIWQPMMSWFWTPGIRYAAFTFKETFQSLLLLLPYPQIPLVISPTRSSFGSERMPMIQRKLDHPRLVRKKTVPEEMRRNYTRDFVHERILVFLSAQEYVDSDPSGRRGTPICTIKQGEEPLPFTGWFHAWDPKMWDKDILQCMQARIKKH